jgi:tRNA(Ile)-lysidine synthase
LVIAVSGGIDSVVLTDLLYKFGFYFVIAHCNFQLRGEESERDEQFVRSLQSKYNKEVVVQQFNTLQYAEENKLSIQEAARVLRYNWFQELVIGHGSWGMGEESYISHLTSHISPLSIPNSSLPFYLLTAHHADDNIETLLMHFFRGTGVHGLTGIPSFDKNRKIIRPLLFAKREQIAGYAKENNLLWVEDSSNASNKYTRNYFRNNLIPSLKEIYPNVLDNLLQNIERFNEADIVYQQAIDIHKKNLLEYKGNEIHVPILKLQKTVPLKTIIWEIIKPYHFAATQIDEIIKLFDAENSSYVPSSTHCIIKNRNWLIIAPLQQQEAAHIVIENGDKKIDFEKGHLVLKQSNAASPIHDSKLEATINADTLAYPLLLRKWKQGDYFYPLGMPKKKKLSKFFIDLKLYKTEKENVWVI